MKASFWRWGTTPILWVALLAAMAACQGGPQDWLVVATATPTATPVPTATFTPLPTPTATPTPTPTPVPLAVQAWTDPPQVIQAHTMLVWVTGNRPITVTGVLSDVPLSFAAVGPARDAYWAIVGVDFDTPEGEIPIHVTARDDRGEEVSQTISFTVATASYPIEYIQLAPGRGNLLSPDIVQKELARIEPVYAEVSPSTWWDGLFTRPITTAITSQFGVRRAYNGGPPGGYHGGIDFRGAVGHPVRAAAAGRVVLAEELYLRGNLIIIDHGLGVHTGYAHLSALKVQAGDIVDQGQVIGLVGDTGLVSGSHLHWEIRIANVMVDPLEWLDRAFP